MGDVGHGGQVVPAITDLTGITRPGIFDPMRLLSSKEHPGISSAMGSNSAVEETPTRW